LLERAVAELHFDPKAAIVIGDKHSDVEFGKRAGAMTILIAPTAPPDAEAAAPAALSRPDAVAANLAEAARVVAAMTEDRRATRGEA
jgi:phosphoglycolate phosphatase-like HAD superfamily hydrolase